ncbi:lymphokine-activated killer T-cell-originated protein kinase-like [Vespa mandarinia]|uniref:lymphokine-activated killer T-cell-originated protein kinase-like n=1 Tax=Vespa mandarinia TaxID=7446 RepID=UPI00160C7253|nr:lymphokine-activated killer T-cell-originated protein kinase-like [Vespa mandarinia]
MEGFKTPVRRNRRPTDDSNLQTPIKIPASPFLQQLAHGTGVHILSLERSPKVGFARSPWAIKKRNSKLAKNSEYDKRLWSEADLLKKLNHPNIVGFRAFTLSSKGEPCLAMEQLDISLGDLIEDRVDRGDDIFAAKDILYVGYEMAKGLEYLHHIIYILHGDIKSYNVLVSKDLKKVKLCDFGVSVPLTKTLEMDKSQENFMYVGTECWNPPEVLFEEGPITNKCDIWAYGLVIWEMLALSAPFVNSDHSSDDIEDISTSEKCMSLTTTNDDNDLTMDDSIMFEEETKKNYGVRPPLPAIDIGPEYAEVLDIFYTCTIVDHKLRPSSKGLVMYFSKIMPSKV